MRTNALAASRARSIALAMTCAVALAGCHTSPGAGDSKKRDAAIIGGGAGAGAIIGAIADGGKGAATGGLIGGTAGSGAVLATRGKEVVLEKGTRVQVKLARSVRLQG